MITWFENNNMPFPYRWRSKLPVSLLPFEEALTNAGAQVNGNDPLEVYKVVKEAHERATNGEGPTLIEAMTDRMTAHSSDDNDKAYRNAEEIEEMKKNDNVLAFGKYLKEVGVLSEEEEEKLMKEIDDEVNKATDEAENAPYAEPEHALKFVYAEEGGE